MAGQKIDIKVTLLRLKTWITRNWPWKLLSLFLAICLWSGLITQDESLTREKVFNDVTINIVNADTLRRNGFIIVSGLENLPTVRFRADVPQKVYNIASASNYNLRIDLARIHDTGEQTLNIISTTTNTYGTVTEMSVSTVTVQVEEYISRSRIPVRLSTTGNPPDGFYAAGASVDPSYVTVSGPRSLVNSIVRCVADYNMALLTPVSGLERTAVPYRLVDASGDEIDSALIDVTSESVRLDSLLVEQALYQTRQLTINTTDLTVGTPAQGYVVKRITAEPATLTIAATNQIINALSEIHLVEFISAPIDISDATTIISRNIRLERPAGIAWFSSDTILITVEIAPE